MKKFFKDESGATAMEYGLIAAIIAMTIVLVLFAANAHRQPTPAAESAPASSHAS